MNKKWLISGWLLFSLSVFAQKKDIAAKGTLFIIGGGRCSPQLMKTMLGTAGLKKEDYIAVLPMASAEPDTAFYYVQASLQNLCTNPVLNFNTSTANVINPAWIDSLQHARLIFIAGGDQSRFMKAVLHTPVYEAVHKAYAAGATIAGTSAGAAVMSKYMITGNELRGDTVYAATFKRAWNDNIEFGEGLGLLQSAIIDQHFIVRSRYNRLISAMAAFPRWPCIGIDEATAIIVHGKQVSVAGEGQVILLVHPVGLTTIEKGLIKFKEVQFSMYTAGDAFTLN